jgi:hypothetical protein
MQGIGLNNNKKEKAESLKYQIISRKTKDDVILWEYDFSICN